MIDEKATYKKFGYYSKDLSRKSHKKVIFKCEDCGKLREGHYSNHPRFCKNCFQKGKRNHSYIDGRSTLTKYCEKCGKKICYVSKLCKSCATREKNIKFWSNKEKAAKRRLQIKEGNKRRNTAKGKNNYFYGKGYLYGYLRGKREKFKGSVMRSSWEVAYAKYCLKNKIKYRYEPKAFPIIFTYEGIKKEGTYRPDFYLPETDEYIEIKGYWVKKAKLKFQSFRQQYSKIKITVLTEEDLKKENILWRKTKDK